MTQARTTKRALLLSCISMLLCMSMLVGTTFAWFTDTATTGVNTIVAGNLDIALYKGNVDDGGITYENDEVTDTTLLFKENAKWEPGYTEVAYLKIANLGNLAVKYKLTIAFSNEVSGTNVAGDSYKLSEVLRYSVVEIGAAEYYANRTAAQDAIKDTEQTLASQAMDGFLTAQGEAKYYAIVVYMPENTGNDANPKTGTTPPSIDIGVSLVATQYTSESDSFGNQYDTDASYPTIPEAPEVEKETFTVMTADQLHSALEAAQSSEADTVTIEITENMALAEGETWEGFESSVGSTNIVINGNGYTISGLNNPLLGSVWGANGTITINDLTLKNSTVVASQTGSGLGAGAFAYSSNASGGMTFNNCHLVDSSVKCTDSYAGGLVGYVASNNAKAFTANGCSVVRCEIEGANSTGALVGQIQNGGGTISTIDNCTVEDVKINMTNGANKTGLRCGLVVGTTQSLNMTNITVKGTNTVTQYDGATHPANQSLLYGRKADTQWIVMLDGNEI